MLSIESIHALKVVELRAELKRRGIKYTSNDLKASLVKMLRQSLIDEGVPSVETDNTFSLDHPRDNNSSSGLSLIDPSADVNEYSTSSSLSSTTLSTGYVTPRTLDLSEKLKELEEEVAHSEQGLISVFFTYQWGPRENTLLCYHKPYADFGYRPTYDLVQAFTSLFWFHNETMNIWSHLIGFVCTLVATVKCATDMYNEDQERYSIERMVLGGYIACAGTCLLLSTIYHWFQCLSPSLSDSLLRLDLTGVALLVGSSYFPAVYFGFYCNPALRDGYLLLATVILIAGIISPWIDQVWFGYPATTIMLASLAMVGVVPFVHWLVVTPEFYKAKIYAGFLWLFFWYGSGFAFYLTFIPEILFPKRFWAVIVLPSHTLWHICVCCAVFSWFAYMWQYEELLREHQCLPYQIPNYSATNFSAGNSSMVT